MRLGKLVQGFIVGIVVSTTIACQSAQIEQETPPPPPITRILATATSIRPTKEITRPPTPSKPNPPTPLPTVTQNIRRPTPENWQTFIEVNSGVILSAPLDWVDIGRLSNVGTISESWGQDHILFVADSLDTGVEVLTGRAITDGAFAIAIRGVNPLPDPLSIPPVDNSQLALQTVLDRLGNTGAIAAISNGIQTGAESALTAPISDSLPQPTEDLAMHVALYLPVIDNIPTPVYLITGFTNEEDDTASILTDVRRSISIESVDPLTVEGIRFLDTSLARGGRDAIIGQLQSDAVDYWAFEADRGQYVTLVLVPEGESDLTVRLLSPAGRTVVEQDRGYGGDTEIVADLLLEEDGVFIIQVSEFFNEADRYTLSIAVSDDPLYSGGGVIRYNEEIQGELQPEGEDIWRFSGQAGQMISIVLDPAGEFDALFTLFSPDGREIATFDEGYSGDAEILGNYELPFTGEYTILVSSFGENGGQYALALDEGNTEIANFYEAGDLAYGDANREFLQAGEAHIWFLPGRAGDEVTIEVRPITANLDLDIWLLDPDRQRLVMEDQALTGEPERITDSLPRDGEYIVMVQEFFGESGEYEIELQVSGDNYLISSGLISYNQLLQSALPIGRGTIWQFDGSAGDLLQFTLSPVTPESDFILSLRDPNGQPVLQADDTAAGNDEVIDEFELSATGVWTLVVQEYFDDGGAYELSIVPLADQP